MEEYWNGTKEHYRSLGNSNRDLYGEMSGDDGLNKRPNGHLHTRAACSFVVAVAHLPSCHGLLTREFCPIHPHTPRKKSGHPSPLIESVKHRDTYRSSFSASLDVVDL